MADGSLGMLQPSEWPPPREMFAGLARRGAVLCAYITEAWCAGAGPDQVARMEAQLRGLDWKVARLPPDDRHEVLFTSAATPTMGWHRQRLITRPRSGVHLGPVEEWETTTEAVDKRLTGLPWLRAVQGDTDPMLTDGQEEETTPG